MDYLIGVSDVTRQGNLRFTVGDGPFLDPEDGVPPLVSLPRLLAASDKVADAAALGDLAAVTTLLDAGSGSLSGARPKASGRGDNGTLPIAQLPHRDDLWVHDGYETERSRQPLESGPRTLNIVLGRPRDHRRPDTF